MASASRASFTMTRMARWTMALTSSLSQEHRARHSAFSLALGARASSFRFTTRISLALAELSVKPYLAGPFTIEWALVAVTPGCNDGEISLPVATLGAFDVAAGEPQITVQDFVATDPKLELAAIDPPQRIQEVELTADGRYRLEIFPRRYRVFDLTSGAKIVDRAASSHASRRRGDSSSPQSAIPTRSFRQTSR